MIYTVLLFTIYCSLSKPVIHIYHCCLLLPLLSLTVAMVTTQRIMGKPRVFVYKLSHRCQIILIKVTEVKVICKLGQGQSRPILIHNKGQ